MPGCCSLRTPRRVACRPIWDFASTSTGCSESGNINEEDRARIDSLAAGSGRSLETVLGDASSALSSLSRYAGLVLAPKTERPFKQVELVPLGPGRALVVVVADNGMVENRFIDVPVGIGASALVEAGTI